MKRFILLITALCTILTFTACKATPQQNDGTQYAIVAGETKIAGELYYSELLSYKNDFLINFLGITEDNEAIWTQDSPSGRLETVGDTIKRLTTEDMVQFAWVIEYARTNGAQITDAEREEIEKNALTMKESFETEAEYEEYLKATRLSDEKIREYLELTLMYDKGFELLTAEDGLYPVSDNAYDEYYDKNFYTVKHIFINNVSKSDSEGNAVALTEDEIEEKNSKADEICQDLESGVSFDVLYMLGEDGMSEAYPDGLTFTDGMIGDTGYENAVKELEVDGWTRVDGDLGGIYIVKKLPLSQTDREDYDSYISNAVNSDIQERIYDDCNPQVTVNQELIDSYNILEVPILA